MLFLSYQAICKCDIIGLEFATMNDGSQLNKTYIIIAIIIGIAILGFGTLNFITQNRNCELDQAKIELEKTKLKQMETKELMEVQANKADLDKCLAAAQLDFDDTFRLNSYADPQPNYPTARTWDSADLEESTMKKLQDDKTLCARLYGSQ